MDGFKGIFEGMVTAFKVLIGIVVVLVTVLVYQNCGAAERRAAQGPPQNTAPAKATVEITAAAPAPPPAPVTTIAIIAVCAPVCQDTDPERAKRNVVWRTLNGELLPDSPERALALGLLPFTRTENGTLAIQDGMDRIVNRFTAYYTTEQRSRMFETLRSGEPDDKVETVQRILFADRAATNLLECILFDKDRMQLVLAHHPVPLE